MTKPETNFIKRIHRKLNSNVYKQAMGLTATNGTPDYYYERSYGAIWVEYKWYPKEPIAVDLTNAKKDPCLSKLQQRWLRRAYHNNVIIAVVAGYPGGCIALWGLDWDRLILDPAKYKLTEIEWAHELNV